MFDFAASYQRIVVLSRRDKLGQAISGTLAQLTGTWFNDGTPPAVDRSRWPQLFPAIAANLARYIEEGRRLAVAVPWSGAVLRLLETTEYQALPVHRPGWLAERLGIDAGTEATSIDALQRAGIVAWDGARYATSAAATITTSDAQA